jgi:hypothetical protein
MKKLLTLMLLLSSFAFVPLTKAANLKTSAALNNPQQLRIQIGHRRYRRHRRDWDDYAYGNRVGYGRTWTVDVQRGFRTYRETYQMIDGRRVLISRVRLY